MDTTATVIAAVRATAKGDKLYVHTNCACAKLNGRKVKSVDTLEGATAYADTNGIEWTLCKTSNPAAPADDVDELDEEWFEGGGAPEFEVIVDNTDQFGKQRRDAIAKMVEALGAELVFKGIKNRHRTGNDAFRVTITKAPAHLEPLVSSFLERMDDEVAEVVDEAKAEDLANGWDANTRQKHYKNTARAYITAQGAELAARLG